jgi:hypothetical protein
MNTPVNDDPSLWPIHHLASTEDTLDADAVAISYANSFLWLHQSAAGQIPSGGFTKEDTSES